MEMRGRCWGFEEGRGGEWRLVLKVRGCGDGGYC